ncbi:LytR/AlgR family response regulator transcription factor [Myroides fluvii]|uniref:LytR/AlgR family response regulator transcription factor n=1 Tax=Myroides fluvii TaxID=2572594 RepID=UPI00131B2FA3|nr:LytTR family transcriptional regulator DNA-binding domain-containing protein [Myroides fluvii]
MVLFEQCKSIKHTLFSSLFLGGLCYFFLAVFQPFGTYNFVHINKYLLLLPYGFFGFSSFLLSDLLFPQSNNSWNWKREVKQASFVLFSCSILSYWYNSSVIYTYSLTFFGWLEMLFYTLLMGLPIYAIHSLLQYVMVREEQDRVAVVIERKTSEKEASKEESVVSIKTEVLQETYQLKETDFVYAHSEGNYCTVYYLERGEIKRQLMRLPLKKLKEQLSLKEIQYCHRSYLVNVNYLLSVKGNAQGGKLYLKEIQHEVPVSRTYIQALKARDN